MEFKIRGNVVLFEALEIKKESKLILNQENKEYKLTIAYIGNGVNGDDLKVGDEILLRNINDKSIVELDGHFYWLTNPANILAVVTREIPVETYTYEETIKREQDSPIINPTPDLTLPHNKDIILPPK